jgi:hypothetical protein
MRRSSKTVDLPSGAKLTVSIDADLYDLHPADRDLVFGIVAEAIRFIDATKAKVQDHEATKTNP